MIRFPDRPAVEFWGMRGKSSVYYLTKPYRNRCGIIPAYFKTDGISSPRFAWRWLHPVGGYFAAAIGHDYRYYLQTTTRKQADLEMLQDLRELDMHPLRQQLVYRSLRYLGWLAWWRNRGKPMCHFWAEPVTKSK